MKCFWLGAWWDYPYVICCHCRCHRHQLLKHKKIVKLRGFSINGVGTFFRYYDTPPPPSPCCSSHGLWTVPTAKEGIRRPRNLKCFGPMANMLGPYLKKLGLGCNSLPYSASLFVMYLTYLYHCSDIMMEQTWGFSGVKVPILKECHFGKMKL